MSKQDRNSRRLPSLDLLKGFDAAARHLSFTLAGEELFLTQSALSRQMQTLEEQLGAPLFERRHRALRLTEAGQVLQLATRTVLDELTHAVAKIRRERSAAPLTISTAIPFAALWLLPRLPRFRLSWSLQLSRAAGAVAAQVWVGPGQANVLRTAGLEMVRRWWRMDRPMTDLPPAPTPVAGYDLIDGTGITRGSWADMHNRSFADHWSFAPLSEEELMRGKSPELSLMAVATATGEPAALTLCQIEMYDQDSRPQPVGLVSSVGTLPEHRRRGLATWLVADGLRRLGLAGARHASLYVDALSHTRAFDAYGKLGFQLAFEIEVWEASFP